MNKWVVSLFFLFQQAAAQEIKQITLTEAYDLSQKNYPAIKQKDLVKQTAQLTIENLQKSFLPQVSISGQASYQSDVTKISLPVPGVSIIPPSKDQYRLVTDVSQLVYDGGLIKQQKEAQQLSAEVENQKVEVELYNLKDRISQIYLSILYLDEQLKQVELVQKDIQTGVQKVEAQVKNGVAFKSSLNVLKAQLLQNEQRKIELRASRKGLVESLGLFINQTLDEQIVLERPMAAVSVDNNLARPELKLYSDQTKLYEHQNKLIQAKNLPKTSLFMQGGYGRPGLNLLKNEFSFFYTSGVRFSWSLGGLYTQKKEKELVKVSQKMVEIQKETFLLNTNTKLKQQESEINKLQQLVETDRAIIDLRLSVKEAAKAQLDNGVITSNDYLREVNAEDQARQLLITHQLQLLQAQINYQTIKGKQ